MTKCEVVCPSLESEIKCEAEETANLLKPKLEVVPKSAAEIVHEQRIK